ncbi:MAG: outer membrane beta-barrel protein [Proteobacteria bacterium]|nr:outer membrane beta-barrel protein [Pseudomonadota bacterium]MBU1417570.1 outer membrane beta-barrel protein [Pseudomonadota bacterium]MBU1456291.1 outer membrane beta-barrel protein [Pseudomonadota bacterium]
MKRKKLLLLICTALTLTPALAAAQASHYVALRGGSGWSPAVDRTAGTRTATVDYENPFSFSAAYGNTLNDWLRLEGELSYLEAKVNEIKGHFGQNSIETGQDKYTSCMVNALADLSTATAFTPFVGIGAGAVYAHHDVSFTVSPGTPAIVSDDKQWLLGYQFMAGVAWEVRPNISVDCMYRFFGTTSRTHEQTSAPITEVDIDPSQIHLVMLGMRFNRYIPICFPIKLSPQLTISCCNRC